MRLFKAEVFEVTTRSELIGHAIHVGYFTHECDAKEVAKGRGEWGADASVQKAKVDVKVFDSVLEFRQDSDEVERQNALAKLSDREKEMLGLLRPKPQ